jgi:hypothetical protein
MSQDPLAYIEEIDVMSRKAKADMLKNKKYVGSADMEFMLRSKNLNWVLRKEIRETDDEKLKIKLKWVYAFWWNRVHFLDTYATHRFSKKGLLRKIDKAARTLRRLIREEIFESDLHPQFKQVLKDLASQIDPVAEKAQIFTDEKDNQESKMADGE